PTTTIRTYDNRQDRKRHYSKSPPPRNETDTAGKYPVKLTFAEKVNASTESCRRQRSELMTTDKIGSTTTRNHHRHGMKRTRPDGHSSGNL
ncbi:hypothetical protein J6590_108008, partial [Homalodisca vitripennis]